MPDRGLVGADGAVVDRVLPIRTAAGRLGFPAVVRSRAELLVPVLVAFGVAIVAADPPIGSSVPRPALHAVIATVSGLVAAFVALLLYGRAHSGRRRMDLLLATAMLAFATSHLAFAAVPHAFLDPGEVPAHMWATVPADVLAGLAFAGAALAGDRRSGARELLLVPAAAAGVLALVGLVVLAVAAELAAPATWAPLESGGIAVSGHPVVVGAQLLAAATFACAAVLFFRRARRDGDVVVRWLAVGALTALYARLAFAATPSAFTPYVALGDVLRLATHVVLLGVCLLELHRYWRGMTEGAVLAERRRIARDLHDGAAQELAFILRRSQRMAGSGDQDAAILAAAARRALEDSRRAIAALARSPDEPLDRVLATAARSTAARGGVPVRLDLEPGVTLPPASADALVRIACEAIANAVRHAGASEVRVELRRDGATTLAISDDGRGFCPSRVDAGPDGGFGLRGMIDRARSVGGELAIKSRPQGGTRIEVVLP